MSTPEELLLAFKLQMMKILLKQVWKARDILDFSVLMQKSFKILREFSLGVLLIFQVIA